MCQGVAKQSLVVLQTHVCQDDTLRNALLQQVDTIQVDGPEEAVAQFFGGRGRLLHTLCKRRRDVALFEILGPDERHTFIVRGAGGGYGFVCEPALVDGVDVFV